MRALWPGTRVTVFDPTLYVDDKKTPLNTTMKSATVLRWYGARTRHGTYPNLVDVRFDHDGRESHAHFGDRL